MFIPKHRKIAFIHIHRTGGTTITQLLYKMKHPTNVVIAGHCHLKTIHDKFDHYDEEFFTFSFVRNPWERLLSWFLLIRQNNTEAGDFQYFVEQLAEHQEYTSGDFMANQADYLTPGDDGQDVNFIGKYEHFQSDIKQLFDILEMPVFEIPVLNSTPKSHRNHYYNATTQKMVAKMCEKDIDRFKYSFQTTPAYG